jgi:tripartite ATP-independent transporter DctP family solute receptor
MLKIRNQFLITLILVLSLSLLAVGCGSNGSQASNNMDTDTDKASNTQKYIMKLGTVEAVDSVKHKACERFKEKVEKATDGNITVELYPASQLGNARAQVEGTQMGTQQASLLPNSNYVSFFSAASITDLPYLFPNREVTYKVMDGKVGQKYCEAYDSTGIHVLSIWESGFKQLTGNFDISKPENFQGKKMRVMENTVLIAQFKALGASAVPINYSETYNALQQGVVDGQENPMMSIYDMKFQEVQKYMAVSDHGWLPLILGVNKDWWDGLPSEYQTAINQAADESRDWLREAIAAEEQKTIIPAFKAIGMDIIELTPEQKEAFATKIKQPTRDALLVLLDNQGKTLLDEITAEVEKQSK